MSKGYIYVLSNPSMPGIVKIGMSGRGGQERADELYKQSSGVPTPFVLEFEIYTEDMEVYEGYIHEELESSRVNRSREFFKLDVSSAIIRVMSVIASNHDHKIVQNDLYIDEVLIDLLAHELKIPVNIICESMYYLTNEDMMILVERRNKRCNKIASQECSSVSSECDGAQS